HKTSPSVPEALVQAPVPRFVGIGGTNELVGLGSEPPLGGDSDALAPSGPAKFHRFDRDVAFVGDTDRLHHPCGVDRRGVAHLAAGPARAVRFAAGDDKWPRFRGIEALAFRPAP